LAAAGLLVLPFGEAACAAGAPPLMATPGQMNVSGTGALSYSVPIIVPPPTAGMGPALALDYSSQNGDGPEGIGWLLSGLPAVTRCPRTFAQDGVHGGVNFDSNDKFCMEGQRLFLVSGAYGADGSQYRTEIDSYSKIIAHGTAGSGPAWFEVHTKAGQVIELGNTSDSRVLPVKADGSGTMVTARAWAADKITDTKGNYLAVHYTNDSANGQVYPTEVDYTGNAAGLTPYNAVKFSYTTRTDIVPSYQAGALMQTTVLLSDIKTYAGTSMILDYKLAYRAATSAATHDELISVTQCDGGSAQKCLTPLAFGWQGSRDSLTYDVVANHTAEWSEIAGPVGTNPILPGDFNGDGLTDYAILVPTVLPPQVQTCPPTQSAAFYYGTFAGGFTGASPALTDGASTAPLCLLKADNLMGPQRFSSLVDFNGDGLTDIYSSQLMFGDHNTVLMNSGGAFTSTGTYNGNSGILGSVGDYDGDGRTDLYPYLSNGDGTFRKSSNPAGGNNPADYDGDGCTDGTSGVYPHTTTFYYSCNPAVATYTTTAMVYPSGGGPIDWITGDFNGDGKADIIDSAGTLFLSTGAGFVATGYVTPALWNNAFYSVTGDFNGDGKTDVVAPLPDLSGMGIYLSTGTGFVLAATLPGVLGDPSVADWNNDGASDVWLQRGAAGDSQYLFHYVPELMVSVSNGLNASTAVTYGRLNDPTLYTKGSGATYPIQDMIGAQYVVSKVQSSDGIGGTYETGYTYAGAKTDLSGRGFLGFSQVTASDPQLHTAQTTVYRMDFPFTGQPVTQTKTWSPPGHAAVTLSSVANIYQTDLACAGGTQTTPPYTVVLCSSVTQGADTDGTPFPSATTSYSYDNFGNVLTSTTLVSDGSSKITTNTWLNDTTNWFLGRLLTSAVQSSIPGSTTLTRHSAFTYDPASGLVTSEIVEPQDTGALRLETDYAYDTFGNKHITTVTGLAATPGGLANQSRAVTATFDARGQFATTIANALNESEQWSYNSDFGTPASHTGPNGIPTSWTYDSFGRVTRETKADGTQTAFSYVYCATGGSCPANGAYYVQATPLAPDGVTVNGATSIVYYDSLSRPIATDTASFDTSPSPWIRSETQYDHFGRAAQASRPYFLGVDAPVWTVSSYTVSIPGDTTDPDPLARAWHVTAPDGSVSAYTYDALNSTVTNALGAVAATTKNAQGLVAQVVDAKGQVTTYAYDSFGDMITANPPGAYILRNTYDLRGRKLSAADSDMGLWHYSTDAFGSLYQQTDAKSQTSTMGYDPLGRLVARTEADMVSAWAYGTSAASHNIDQLVSASCTSGASGNACGPGYSRAYAYDGVGRPSQLTLSTGGINYHSISTYDPTTGQLASARNFSGFTLDYSYSARGYLTSIRDDATGTAYFTANARNAAMQLTQSMAGNGVVTIDSFGPLTGRMLNVCATNHATSACDGDIANISTDFDAVGNLTVRGDMLHGVNESFTYDPLNRLSTSSLTGPGTSLSRTMRYDASGNITEKSDVCAVNGCFRYDGPQPHAVSSITGTVNGVTNPNYFYDGNGNLRCMTALAQCDASAAKTVAWTSFNMVSTVQQGTTNVSLLYDEGHARLQQTAPEGTTQYLNDPANGVMTERFAPSGGGLYWKSYVLADGKIVAERSVKGTNVTVRYFTLDHLGSTVALTDEHGTLAESDAYDAWGKARDAATGADDPTCSKPGQSFTTRGFSGHEEMADLCLVNMNARVYDPTIGRFMSPDDVIPDQYNGQSYNRYTYVDDNPLSYEDPTGHLPNTNSSALADMSAAGHVTVYVDSSGEMHAMTGDADLNNMINHALNESASHGGVSGSHLALAFSGGRAVGAIVFGGPSAPTFVSAPGFAANSISASHKSGSGKYQYDVHEGVMRQLTSGERQMAQEAFNGQLNSGSVRLQWSSTMADVNPGDDAVTNRTDINPAGHPNTVELITFTPEGYRADFSHIATQDDFVSAFEFVHELGHAWQFQNGVNAYYQEGLLQQQYVNSRVPYDAHLSRNSSWGGQNIEQQANLVATRWAEAFGPKNFATPSGDSQYSVRQLDAVIPFFGGH
jgi:RHS repeat-associated protein